MSTSGNLQDLISRNPHISEDTITSTRAGEPLDATSALIALLPEPEPVEVVAA